ncbi:MAG TPA: hypothetical protein VFS92_09330 [Planctomycetota bacterium]|nr:hypothetical protein [Planctomycetota bacterium]
MDSEELRRYLDRVEGNLQGPGKGDILREIESHILDRAEALAAAREAAPGPEDLRRAIEELGDPSDLAISYSGEKHLVSPKEYAAFWYFTLLVFAVHTTTLLVAFATQAEFAFFPFNVLPGSKVRTGGAAAVIASLIVQAFLFDVGLVTTVFFLLRRTFRRVELPNLTFRVESSRRPSLFRALFAGLLLVLLGLPQTRDWVFRVRVEGRSFGMFLPAWHAVSWLFLSFVGLVLVKDLLYLFLQERVLTVAADLGAAVAGVIACGVLFAQPPLLGLPDSFPLDDATRTLFNESMGRVVDLALLVLAALFAARAVKRAVRVRQLWGEKDPARL